MTDIITDLPYIQYNYDVLEGNIVAPKYIKLACKRMDEWFKRDDIYFDYAEANKRIRFVSKMKHFKGKAAGSHFKMLPYQQWIYANIFGWKYTNNGLRVTKNVLLFMARKSG